MTGLTFSTALPLRGARPASRPALTAPPATITPAEADRIASDFPERPSVAQKLYGPGRQIHQAAPLGTHIDVSA